MKKLIINLVIIIITRLMDFKLLSEINYNIEGGNSVDLPHDVLEKISSESKELPYFFEICTQSSLKSYVGVRQFTADKDTIQLPSWLNSQLGIDGNQILTVTLLENVPKGKYIKLRPETEDFFDVPDYESCLETKLSQFPLLYQGQVIQIEIFDKNYEIKVEEVEQDWENFNFEKGTSSLELNVINVVNTDINVDINNTFLKKRLEEEALAEKKRKEEEQEMLKRLQEQRIKNLQKAKQENLDSTPKSFQSKGNRLSDDSNNKMSMEEIRLARLKYYSKYSSVSNLDSNKKIVKKTKDDDIDV